MITGLDLRKNYRGTDGQPVAALDHVNFTVREGEFYVLLGPSGSGKTTTLRAIAGLEHPDEGLITMAGRDVFSSADGLRVAPEQRPIAMVFQSYALWPHMDVYENIAFPLRRGLRRIDADKVRPRVEGAAEMLNLGAYLRRPVSQLSGGQQQRVALARALALEPSVLLMDEPLSNLDARLRARLRVELKALTRAIGITTIYVTHDQTEAMVMGDRIAVMESGRMLQEGSPADLYQRPRELFVARFLGDMNLLDATVGGSDADGHMVTTPAGPLRAGDAGPASARQAATLGFRPEDAVLRESPAGNGIHATVVARHYLGDSQQYQLDAGGAPIQVRAPKTQIFEPGAQLFVGVDAASCLLFTATGKETKP